VASWAAPGSGTAERSRRWLGRWGWRGRFVGGVLGVGHPCVDVAVLLVSELVTNSVLHGGSAMAGGQVTVTVSAGGRGVRVAVAERAGPGVPVLVPDAEAETVGGRGMWLVDALAARWGYERCGGQAVTWFELRDLTEVTRPGQLPVCTPAGTGVLPCGTRKS
jgi:anti-sigma regulatory factor (Ser/Thr protein kinase)